MNKSGKAIYTRRHYRGHVSDEERYTAKLIYIHIVRLLSPTYYSQS